MRIEIGIIKSKIVFEQGESYLKPEVEKVMHTKLGVRGEGYQFSPLFKRHIWDGYTDFYDKDTQQFHTGLCDQVDNILGDLQSRFTFKYTFDDLRPEEAFVEPDEMEEKITLLDKEGKPSITLRDYQYNAVKSVLANRIGIVRVGTGGGKTSIASGVIKQLLPYLRRKERIAFFTNNSSIFTQSARNISEQLGIDVGMYGGGQKKLGQVTFVMIPTINSAMNVDLEKGLKLPQRDMVIKRIAKEVAPNFLTGSNQKAFLRNYINLFKVKNKTDQMILDKLEDMLYTTGTDAQLVMKFNAYAVKYQQMLQKRNKKAYDKKADAMEFLQSIAVMIVDEAHHTSSDTWFNTLSACTNAEYRVALTGSIDMKNKLLYRRMQALFCKPIIEVASIELIERGLLAKPTITLMPITIPTNFYEKSYMTAYNQCIVNNEYRNKMIATLTDRYYREGNSILIIVKQIEHGNLLSSLLEGFGTPHVFIHGETAVETRDKYLEQMRQGTLKVMIATTIMDEGVDVAGINMLILGAGDKSFRQTIQRIGRALRPKPGDNKATIIDFMDYTNKHLLKHSKERVKVYEGQQFDVNEIAPN